MLNKVTLGRTGLEVTPLALGGLFVSSYGAEVEQAREAVERAVALGINYVDSLQELFMRGTRHHNTPRIQGDRRAVRNQYVARCAEVLFDRHQRLPKTAAGLLLSPVTPKFVAYPRAASLKPRRRRQQRQTCLRLRRARREIFASGPHHAEPAREHDFDLSLAVLVHRGRTRSLP